MFIRSRGNNAVYICISLLDTLMVFMKYFVEIVHLGKKSKDNYKHAKITQHGIAVSEPCPECHSKVI